jgi:hypothetical protein
MVWSRKPDLHLFLVMLLLLSAVNICAQNSVLSNDSLSSSPSNSGTTQVWTDEDWNQAKKGIGYEKIEPKKKEIEETEASEIESTPYEEKSSSNNWLQSEAAKVICITLIIAILVFIIIRFVLGAKMDNSKVIVESVEMLQTIEDNLEGTDLNPYLNKAVEAIDYKTAVRILYLSVIQKLNDLKWIRWKKDKTNNDFLMEMSDQSTFRTFRNLTLSYEIVWYGEAQIGSTEFETMKKEFDTYKNSLNQFESRK